MDNWHTKRGFYSAVPHLLKKQYHPNLAVTRVDDKYTFAIKGSTISIPISDDTAPLLKAIQAYREIVNLFEMLPKPTTKDECRIIECIKSRNSTIFNSIT